MKKLIVLLLATNMIFHANAVWWWLSPKGIVDHTSQWFENHPNFCQQMTRGSVLLNVVAPMLAGFVTQACSQKQRLANYSSIVLGAMLGTVTSFCNNVLDNAEYYPSNDYWLDKLFNKVYVLKFLERNQVVSPLLCAAGGALIAGGSYQVGRLGMITLYCANSLRKLLCF